MSELRTTTQKDPPKASLATGAPSSPDLPARQAGKSPRSLPVRQAGDRGQTPVPGPAGRARRTRGKAPKARGGGGSRKRGSAAASDDASGLTGMDAASSAATPPARPACAAAAQPPAGGATPRVPGDAPHGAAQDDDVEGAVGKVPLPNDGPAFVEAMHARVDLFAVWQQLLNSTDVRVKQRAAERMLEVKFGKGPPPVEETETRLVWDARRLTQDPQGREE